MEYEALVKSIDKIVLTKEEEKAEYYPQFKELYGDVGAKEVSAIDPYYLNKMRETMKQLQSMREQYSSNKEFYIAVSNMFAQSYIPLMVQEFNITDEEILSKLNDIASGNGIMIFDRGEAQEYAKSFGDKIGGDVGAFKYRGKVCFTPDNENKEEVVSANESITNAAKLLGTMIHETMHIIINVMKDEHFNYGEESRLTSGGHMLNEGLVEMHALDFAKKYGFVAIPAMYYMNNVKMCRTLKELYGEKEFERLALSGNYEEIIPPELLDRYKMVERIRYYQRKGYTVDPSQIDLTDVSQKTM